jgi:hypothetical protein
MAPDGTSILASEDGLPPARHANVEVAVRLFNVRVRVATPAKPT